uniref:poly(ADP-ribose) glycohydrolase n=1 Tax=Hymenolepis diminuta TaxID=6216 RepID=A0A0R3SQX8_HYMDI
LTPQSPSGANTWDNEHAKLPCSPNNVLKRAGKTISIWESIKSALTSPINSVDDFMDWNCKHLSAALHIKPDYVQLLPKIAQLALRLPELVTKPIPLLKRGAEGSVTLSQLQIACLLANAFYSTFTFRNSRDPQSEYSNFPLVNFASLFSKWHQNKNSSSVQKIVCILHYFSRIFADDFTGDGVVTFTRRCIADASSFASSDIKFNSISFGVSSISLIEDVHPDTMQVDFADPFLGGLFLNKGCAQEEILCCYRPEIIAGMIFMEAMECNEAFIIEGAERFSRYSGYFSTFQWTGNYDEIKDGHNSRTEDGHWKGVVVAIDAQHYRARGSSTQYTTESIQRELNKAYCGFTNILAPYKSLPDVVVSGNWGCGIFKGDRELKCLIQLMACAQSGKSLAYCAFSNSGFGEDALKVFKALCDKNCSVGAVLTALTTEFSKHS